MARTTISKEVQKQVHVAKKSQTHIHNWLPLDSGAEVRLFRDANEIPDEEWNKLNHTGNLFTDLNYLRGLQHTSPPEMGFWFVMLRRNTKIIGGFIFQTINLTPDALAEILAPFTGKKSIVGGISEWLTRCREEKGLRVLISGNNFISGKHGVLVAAKADPHEVFGALAGVVKLIVSKDIVPHKISLILVKDYFSGEQHKPEESLKKRRYHSFAVEPEMILRIQQEWSEFPDYVNSMSKKYRNRTKSVMAKSSVLVEHVLDAVAIENNVKEFYRLYKNLHDKARFRLAALTPEYFSEMQRRFPDNFRFFLYTLNGKAVGFRTYFKNNDQLEAHFIGLDYSVNRDLHLYQRILYDFVNDALAVGSRSLLLGRTAGEIKSTIGAVPSELTCYIRHRNSLSNQIIRPFIDYLKPTDWTPRGPFK